MWNRSWFILFYMKKKTVVFNSSWILSLESGRGWSLTVQGGNCAADELPAV